MPQPLRDDRDDLAHRSPSDSAVDRRTLLKLAGAAAVTVPGLSLLGRLSPGGGAVAAVGTGGATEDPRSAAAATLGGAAVRPPSIPLAVRSPYLSTWLPSTRLTATRPKFWHGSPRGFAGLVRIDGAPYAWAGTPQVAGALAPAMPQKSVHVTATRSIFTFEAGGVELVAEWLSPIEPGDLRRQSAPLSLLTVSARAVGGVGRVVQVYADITGQWASSDESALIDWRLVTGPGSRAWTIQLEQQQPLTENAHMAQWGSVIWATALHPSLSYRSGYAIDVRNQFATEGRLADASDHDFRAVDDDQPVFAFAREFGSAGTGSFSLVLGHVRMPLVSYGQNATPLSPLWTRYWPDWQAMTEDFLADAVLARRRAAALDTMVEGAATSAAGIGYSAICALALRQCYGGTELAIGPHGDTWLLGKEISTSGDVNTVDIFDQAFLAWLWMDPARVPLVMEPILDWCASPAWQDPSAWANIPSWEDSQTRYCVHDLGKYPVASGRVPGAGEQMPIEESAGMLIMAAAYARKVGADKARHFLARWQPLWTQWAEYLLTQVPSPATQLTTDDWAPVYPIPTGSVNLGIKAIIGLAAAGQIAAILGDAVNASAWSTAATDNIEPWVTRSTDPSGEYLNLQQGAAGTWSTLYNAYYQQVIGVSLVPEEVAAKQAAFYRTRLTTYGLPLQTDANDVSKVAWQLYIPAWLERYPIRDELLSRDVAYINDTPSLVPYADRYNTSTGVEVGDIHAHPTLGAVYALLALEP